MRRFSFVMEKVIFVKEAIINKLKQLTGHNYIEIPPRGNTAITAALSSLPKNKKILIPKEGGWLAYRSIPKKLNLPAEEVKCNDAKILLEDLKEKVKGAGALIYQNPGGYFAEQPTEEIYELCRKNNCLVILDVSGSIGTKLCGGNHADILVGSFGKWKLVEAGAGGFISCKNKDLFEKLKIEKLDYEETLKIILKKLNELDGRINFLAERRNKIINGLKKFNIVHKDDLGFVVVVKFFGEKEKREIMEYCKKNGLEWTECPRYIRLNKPAISIEVKRLQRLMN